MLFGAHGRYTHSRVSHVGAEHAAAHEHDDLCTLDPLSLFSRLAIRWMGTRSVVQLTNEGKMAEWRSLV